MKSLLVLIAVFACAAFAQDIGAQLSRPGAKLWTTWLTRPLPAGAEADADLSANNARFFSSSAGGIAAAVIVENELHLLIHAIGQNYLRAQINAVGDEDNVLHSWTSVGDMPASLSYTLAANQSFDGNWEIRLYNSASSNSAYLLGTFSGNAWWFAAASNDDGAALFYSVPNSQTHEFTYYMIQSLTTQASGYTSGSMYVELRNLGSQYTAQGNHPAGNYVLSTNDQVMGAMRTSVLPLPIAAEAIYHFAADQGIFKEDDVEQHLFAVLKSYTSSGSTRATLEMPIWRVNKSS